MFKASTTVGAGNVAETLKEPVIPGNFPVSGECPSILVGGGVATHKGGGRGLCDTPDRMVNSPYELLSR